MSPGAEKETRAMLETLEDEKFLALFEYAISGVGCFSAICQAQKIAPLLGCFEMNEEPDPSQSMVRGMYSGLLELPIMCMEEAYRRFGAEQWEREVDCLTVDCDGEVISARSGVMSDNFNGEVNWTLSYNFSEQSYYSWRWNWSLWDQKAIDSDFIERPVFELQW